MIKIKSSDHSIEYHLPNDFFVKNKVTVNYSLSRIQLMPPSINQVVNCDLQSIQFYQDIDEDPQIIIPALKTKLRSDDNLTFITAEGTRFRFADKIFVSWQNQQNLRFLDYNPRIWLFVYRNSIARYSKMRKKGWRHPQHLKTKPFPGSKYYNSEMQDHACAAILASGRKTEFYCPTNANQWLDLNWDFSDWFYPVDTNYKGQRFTQQLLFNDFIAGLITEVSCGDKQNWLKTEEKLKAKKTFRFAIVCDNPKYNLTNGESPVIIGPISETIKTYFDI